MLLKNDKLHKFQEANQNTNELIPPRAQWADKDTADQTKSIHYLSPTVNHNHWHNV